MKTSSVLSIFLFFPIILFSQDFNFNVSGRSGYSVLKNQEYTRSYENVTSRIYINDSMAVENLIDTKNTNNANYKSKITYEFEANINFPIYRNASIQTGIGLSWLSFRKTSEFISYESIIKEQGDTISYDWNPTTGGSTSCDRIVNQEVLNERENGELYKTLNLTIPLSLKYNIPKTKLSIKTGVYLQTPIFSEVSSDYVRVEVEETPTETICTYVLESNKDNTGQRIEDLQFGAHAEVEYRLLDKLSASIRFSQHFSDLTFNNYFSFETVTGDKFIPTRITAGLNLYLGKDTRKTVITPTF